MLPNSTICPNVWTNHINNNRNINAALRALTSCCLLLVAMIFFCCSLSLTIERHFSGFLSIAQTFMFGTQSFRETRPSSCVRRGQLFLFVFHLTEDDSVPDRGCLLRQRRICDGEFLLWFSPNKHIIALFGCFSRSSFPLQGESHPVGSLCDFQAWWLTYFGKTVLHCSLVYF